MRIQCMQRLRKESDYGLIQYQAVGTRTDAFVDPVQNVVGDTDDSMARRALTVPIECLDIAQNM